ncbi:MAG: response regulator [Deltaproteobacteria bacterium]|nr:response regulator [Deltaproteobacteria bacterium]MBW1870900.1 response regulator [Deltaproteobacteria bacterium]
MTKRIGNLLLEAGIVSNDQLKAAIGRQRRFGGRLATSCLAQGYCDERALARILSRQLGVPFVVLSRSAIPLSLLDNFPLDLARKLNALPVHRHDRELIVAMADPTNIAYLDEIRFTTGARVIEHGAMIGCLHDAIEDAYRLKERGDAVFCQGVDFDPSTQFGDEGHLEIVVGQSDDPAARPDSPVVSPEPEIDMSSDWVDRLTCTDQPADDPGKLNLLLVEDEHDLRKMLAEFFTKSGCDVWEAADGTEAVRMLQERLPQAIVLDAMLPGVHGFDICYRVKHSEGTRHIPVVMISAVYRGWRYADDVRRLYGADAFLEKPLRLDELKHVLDKCVSESGSVASPEELNKMANDALQEAAVAYRKGDLFGAAHHLKEAVEAAPFSPSLHHRLGLLYDRLDEPYRAIAEMERAVQLEPTYKQVLSLAQLYEKTGFTSKAFEAWERCLRLSEDPAEQERIHNHMDKLLP